MDWQKVAADKAEGSMKSNPFAGFEAYANAPYAAPEKSEAVEEGEEAATAPRNFAGGSVPTDNYETRE